MSQAPDKTQLRHRMRTLRAEAAARDPDAAERAMQALKAADVHVEVLR